MFHSLFSQITSNAALGNNIITALLLMSLGTTVSATSLIGYKILTALQINILQSQRTYNCIMTIIMELSTLYALVLLFYALIAAIPQFVDLESPLSQVSIYTEILVMTTAVHTMHKQSTTMILVMVARLALVNTGNIVSSSTITSPISGMNFGPQQDRGDSASDIAPSEDIEHVIDHEQVSVIELKQESKIPDISPV